MMKKKLEVVKKVTDIATFNKYMAPEFDKIVVINVYDSFWGPVEVADMMIKRFLDTADHSEKTEFICVDKNISVEYFGLQQSMIEGIDFPTLCNEIERCFSLIET